MRTIPKLSTLIAKTKLRPDVRILIDRCGVSSEAKLKLSYAEYRTRFIKQGTTINKWAKANDIHNIFVYDAMKGGRKGPAARRIVSQANQFLGL